MYTKIKRQKTKKAVKKIPRYLPRRQAGARNELFDFLVIGSGIAGLNFALQAAEYGKVAIVTKKELMESNSNYAQGGIAAVLSKTDNFKKHINDTLKAGCYLNDKQAVEIMVKQAPKEIKRLIDFGVGFNKNRNKLCLTKEGGHSAKRIAYVHDATGKEIERVLIYNIRHHKNIEIFESHIAFELITQDNTCFGALALDRENSKIRKLLSKATILASGGAGQVYARNSNPKIATGDGVAMAYRAGAKIRDMEFIQFHPTALAKRGKPAFLLSEALRGEGAFLLNSRKKRFMHKYHPARELAPRDVVTRAIFNELNSGPVYLDIRHKGAQFIKHRFPYIYEQLWWYGLKMEKDLIPVAPAAHFVCGGIHTDLNGRTSIKGLSAFGEVAHTGVHGANRLASNSLLECMVFSSRAIKSASKYIKNIQYFPPRAGSRCGGTIFPADGILPPPRGGAPPAPLRRWLRQWSPQRDNIQYSSDSRYQITNNKQYKKIKTEIQKLMWNNVGIIRKSKKMEKTLKILKKYYTNIIPPKPPPQQDPAYGGKKILDKNINPEIIELRSLIITAILITQAALKRKKSIGVHFIEK